MKVSTETQRAIRNQLISNLDAILTELSRGNDIELRKSPEGVRVLVVKKQVLASTSER